MAVVAPPETERAEHAVKSRPLFDPPIVRQAIIDIEMMFSSPFSLRKMMVRCAHGQDSET